MVAINTSSLVRLSVSSLGAQSNERSFTPAVSANGRFVAFESQASNLSPADLQVGGDISCATP